MDSDIRIGDRLVRPTLHRVEGKDGDEVAVSPKAMEVLMTLAAQPNAVVSKDQLVRQVWSDTFVADEVLTNAIWELRKALGDQARAPRFIQTIPKRGYRLIAAVHRPPESPESPVRVAKGQLLTSQAMTGQTMTGQTMANQTPASQPIASQPRSRKRWLVAAAILSVVLLGALVRQWQGKRLPAAQPHPLIVHIEPFSAASGMAEASENLRRTLADALQSRHLEIFLRQASRAADVIVTGSVTSQQPLRLRLLAEDGAGRLLLAEESTDEHLPPLLRRLRRRLELEQLDRPAWAEDMKRTDAASVDAYEHFRLAEQQIRSKRWAEALTSLRQALAADPDFAHAYERRAHVYYVKGEVERARQDIEAAIDAAAHLPVIEKYRFYRRRAQILERIGEERSWLEALEMEAPEDRRIQQDLAWFYFTHDRACDKALARYERALAGAVSDNANGKVANDANGFSYWAEAQLGCGLPSEQGLASVRRYLALRPEDPDAHYTAAYVHLLTGDLDATQNHITDALRLAPNFPYALLLQGDLYRARGAFGRAAEAYDRFRALAIGASRGDVYHCREARLLLVQGRFEAAQAAATAAVRSNPSSLEAHWLRGVAQVTRGELETAETTLQQMHGLSQASQSRYEAYYIAHLQGRIHQARDELGAAVADFRAALDLHPLERAFFLSALATALYRQGNWGEATTIFDAALRFNPNYAPAHCGLGLVYEAQGRMAAAREAHGQCRTLWADADQPPWLLRHTRANSQLSF